MSFHAVNTMGGGSRRSRRVQSMQDGGAWYNDVWNGVKKGYRAVKSVHDYVKDNKLASKILSQIPHPKAQGLAKAAEMAGYGKKRPRKMAGGARRTRIVKKN